MGLGAGGMRSFCTHTHGREHLRVPLAWFLLKLSSQRLRRQWGQGLASLGQAEDGIWALPPLCSVSPESGRLHGAGLLV